MTTYVNKPRKDAGEGSVFVEGIGPISQARNRNINSASTTYASATNTVTWETADNITSLVVLPLIHNNNVYDFWNIATATTTTLVSGDGMLHALTINLPVASGTVTLYDNTAASGTKIATVTLPAVLLEQGPHTAIYDAGFSTGLTSVNTGANMDITLTYKKNDPIALIVLGAPNEATASGWLADTGSASADVQYYPVYRDKPLEIQTSTAITRLDVLPYVNSLRLWVGAN